LEFSNEKLYFDVQDPTSVENKDGVVFMEIALYDDNWMSDKCVCVAKVDVTDEMERPMFYNDGPKVLEVDLHKPGTTEDCGTIKVKVEFWAAKFGVVRVVCNDCTNLNDTSNMLDKQDPYVYLSIGEERARTETLSNAGAKPDWKGEELLIFVDEKNWNKPFKLDIFDDDFGSDSLIASHTLDLFNMMAENSAPYSSIPLLTQSGKDAGTFNCNCDFLPFGQLNVIVHSAKSLRNPDSWGKPDPYIMLSLDQCQPAALKALPSPVDQKSKEVKKIIKDARKQTGECAKKASITKQTQTIDSTLDPEWLAELSFDYVDATTLKIVCYDEDVGSDDLIGSAEVDLSEVIHFGKSEAWVSLVHTTKKGTVPAGDVKIQMYFWGQPGTPFPHRPGPSTSVFADAERQWGAGTAFPPAKAPFDVHDSAKYLAAPGVMESTGIVQVEVVEGSGIKGKDSKLFAYVRAKVGKKGKSKKTKNVKCKSSDGSGTADWSNEQLDIPVSDLFKLEENGEINLYVDLMDDNNFKDTNLGSVTIPLKGDFISKPNVPVEAEYQISGGAGAGTLKLKTTFLKSQLGALLVTLVDAKNLANRAGIMSSAKSMDPYVQIEVNKAKPARSRTINNGGKTPNFNNQELLIFCDEKESWKEDVEITVYDDNIGVDAIIGKHNFGLMNYMNPKDTADADAETGTQSLSLSHKGKMAGELRAGLRFLPAGKLTVKCIAGRELRNPDSFGTADPYVQLSADSQMQQLNKKFHTNTHSDGGTDPQWNFDCEIDIIDQFELKVECMDKDMLSSDLIGDAELSLLDLFKEAAASENSSASLDVWLPLSYSKNNERKPAGDVHLVLYFVGAAGTTYPLYRPTITGDSAGMDGVDAVGGVQEGKNVCMHACMHATSAQCNI
jgi:hypothetical protein